MIQKNNNITAAVIGCGKIGAGVQNYSAAVRPGSHADAYRLHPDIDLIAFLEIDPERKIYLQEEYPGVKIFDTIDALCESQTPDIVSIANPTEFHMQTVLALAEYAPKAIICEKPLAYSVEDGEKMIAACREKGVLLFVNHQRHFDPLLQKWANQLKQGMLGEVYQGNAYYYNGFFNNGTHLIDLLLLFCGSVASVSARYNTRTGGNGEDDKNIDAELIFANGLRVTLHSLSANYGFFGFSLFGEEGMLSVQNLGFEIVYRKKIDNAHFPGFFELSAPVITEGKPRSMISSTIDHVVAVISGNASAYGTGEDALAVLRILIACKKSANDDGLVIRL